MSSITVSANSAAGAERGATAAPTNALPTSREAATGAAGAHPGAAAVTGSRLGHETISMLAKRNSHGRPGGAPNLVSVPALPAQPVMAPLSTYAPPQLNPRGGAGGGAAGGPEAVLVEPGQGTEAAAAALEAAGAAALALGVAAGMLRQGASAVSGAGEQLGVGAARAAGGAGAGERADGGVAQSTSGGMVPGAHRVIRFELSTQGAAAAAGHGQGIGTGPDGGLPGSGGGGGGPLMTYVRLPEPTRVDISKLSR